MDICKYRELHLKEIVSILEEKDVCSLGTSSKTDINITPMLFAFDYIDSNIDFFFIYSDTKSKSDSEHLCIYLDNSISNFYTDAYQTVLAKGKPEEITDISYKNHIISLFRKKYHKSLKDITSCPDIKFIKVHVDTITSREYIYDF